MRLRQEVISGSHLVALVLVSAASAAAPLAAAATPDFAALDSDVIGEMKATATPGAAIAVVLGDSVVFSRGYGVASVETGEPVTPSTPFRVASTTKMLVAAALAAFAELGKVDFAAPISTYAPGRPAALPARSRPSLRTEAIARAAREGVALSRTGLPRRNHP